VLLHASRVLEVVPEGAAQWRPLIHDSFLLFLDRMSDERFVERLVAQASLPRDASRGDRVLAFVADAPSLQKLAQILARNPELPADLRESLQTMENGLSTARYDGSGRDSARLLPRRSRSTDRLRGPPSAEASVARWSGELSGAEAAADAPRAKC
jgi:hypothetical protein